MKITYQHPDWHCQHKPQGNTLPGEVECKEDKHAGHGPASAETSARRRDAGCLCRKPNAVREDTANEIEDQEFTRAVEFFEPRAGPPEHEHVEEEMPERGMQEDRSHETPQFALNDRQIRILALDDEWARQGITVKTLREEDDRSDHDEPDSGPLSAPRIGRGLDPSR